MQPPRAILFDADGVVQRVTLDIRDALLRVLSPGDARAADFMREVFAIEKPALTGERDFIADLRAVLERHGIAEREADVLAVWTAIEPDSSLLEAVQRLRAGGLCCCLATNQQPYRAQHMSRALGYHELFDHEFYSHTLELAKPDPAYFRAIVQRLALPPEALLFIDDHEPNVTAARSVGLQAAVFTAAPNAGLSALRAILEQHGIALE